MKSLNLTTETILLRHLNRGLPAYIETRQGFRYRATAVGTKWVTVFPSWNTQPKNPKVLLADIIQIDDGITTLLTIAKHTHEGTSQ